MEQGCEYCAYAEKKDGTPVWCKFHDEAVTEENTCENFLSFLDTPVMSTLLTDKFNKSQSKKISLGTYVKDIIAYIFITWFIVMGICVFLFF